MFGGRVVPKGRIETEGYELRDTCFVFRNERRKLDYLRREGRRVNGLQGYNVNEHGKVACLFCRFQACPEPVEGFQVSGSKSIIREIGCLRIRM